MRTDELIAVLAADRAADRAAPGGRAVVAAVLAAGAAASFALMVLGLGLRADLAQAARPIVAAKTVLPALLAAGAAAVALRLGRPTGRAGRPGRALLAVPAATLALMAATLATEPRDAWAALTFGTTWVYCVALIPALALPPLAAFLWVLRRGAPMAPRLAGMAAGLAAGACAAAVYSLHCFEDSPLFFGTWYTAGIALSALAGRAAGARLLRW